MASQKNSTKKTGINKGIEKGVSTQQFTDKVICKKCHKEIDFILGSELFLRCPRCNARVERDIKNEEKKAKKIIKWDILRRSKKAQLSLGFTLMVLVLAYNIIGFVAGWFDSSWWIGLLSVPVLLLSYFLMKGTRKGSASMKYRFYAWLALIVNFAVLLVVIATCVPFIADKLHEFIE